MIASIDSERLPIAFAALGDDMRWTILLRRAGLVEAEPHGREVRFRAIGSRISALARDLDAVAHGWDARLRKVKQLAERDRTGEHR